jgi:hypothetical protein
MMPAITTTHAIPQSLPSGNVLPQQTAVRCRYCLAVLGLTSNPKKVDGIQAAHNCKAKKLAKKPAASVPFN